MRMKYTVSSADSFKIARRAHIKNLETKVAQHEYTIAQLEITVMQLLRDMKNIENLTKRTRSNLAYYADI